LHTIAGKTISGDIVTVSDKEIVLRGSKGQIRTALQDVLVVELQHDPSTTDPGKVTAVELSDGPLRIGIRVTRHGKEWELKLAVSGAVVKVQLSVLSYHLNDAEDPADRQEWQEKHLRNKRHQDILAIKLNGVINDVEGTLGEGNDKGEIRFESGTK